MLFETLQLEDAEIEVLEQIDALKVKLRWRMREPQRRPGSIRRMQFARAVQGSNSIDGSRTSG